MDFEGTLIFCNDSKLRIKSEHKGKTVFFPLVDLQELENESDDFILKFFRRSVKIEKDTTLKNIILALEPWGKILTNFIDRDILAYCEACKNETNEEQTFATLEICKFSHISRYYDIVPQKEGQSFIDWLNSDDNRIITNDFNKEESIQLSGFFKDDSQHYSTSEAFVKICNTPVVIVEKSYGAWGSLQEPNILKKNIRGIEHHKNYASFSLRSECNFMDIIEAVFAYGLFYYSPRSVESVEAEHAHLKSLVDSLDEEKENASKTTDNVVAFPGTTLVEDDADSEEIEEEGDKKISIKVVPGAFDGIIQHEEDVQSEWDYVFKSLASKSDIKFGNIEYSESEKSLRDGKKE